MARLRKNTVLTNVEIILEVNMKKYTYKYKKPKKSNPFTRFSNRSTPEMEKSIPWLVGARNSKPVGQNRTGLDEVGRQEIRCEH